MKGVVNKLKKKLSSWKARTLSSGGRLTLIKAVLGNLPTYYMSLYRMSVAEEIGVASKQFFYGGDLEDKKMT